MLSLHATRLRTRIDAILAGEPWSEARTDATIAELIEVLAPADAALWPDATVLLYLSEHAAVRERLHELPGALEEALLNALRAAAPLLGIRVVGPVGEQVRQMRQRFDAEERKFELVAARLSSEQPEATSVRMLAAYLDTNAAPIFVSRMRVAFPRIIEAAEHARAHQFDPLLDAPELLAALAFPDEPIDALRATIESHLTRLAASLPDLERTLRMALADKRLHAQLVAGALAVRAGLQDFAAPLLGLVTSNSPAAPQAAVFAGLLDPLVTRNVLSQFLLDASWVNPEEPEIELTPRRARALLAARCVLPRVGSPLPDMSTDFAGAALPSEELRELPAMIDRAWRVLEELACP